MMGSTGRLGGGRDALRGFTRVLRKEMRRRLGMIQKMYGKKQKVVLVFMALARKLKYYLLPL